MACQGSPIAWYVRDPPIAWHVRGFPFARHVRGSPIAWYVSDPTIAWHVTEFPTAWHAKLECLMGQRVYQSSDVAARLPLRVTCMTGDPRSAPWFYTFQPSNHFNAIFFPTTIV